MPGDNACSSRPCGVVAIGLLAAFMAGCISHARLNRDCGWTGDPTAHLNIALRPDREHLVIDINTAEELAIRHTDALRGQRSGHWAGRDVYNATREECLSTLVATISARHDVDPDAIRSLIGSRPAGFDFAVLLPFAFLYALIAYVAAGTLVSRFPRDEPLPALIASVSASALASVAGYMALAVWGAAAEMVRLGDQHMSYRAARLPWNRHTGELLVIGTVLFLAMAVIRYRRAPASESVRLRDAARN